MPDAMKTLYWIRHAKPAYPGGRRICLGQKVDAPLSEEGILQAQRLARRLASRGIEAVYASPMLRARQTAAYITGENLPMHVLDTLTELDGGEWDGLTFDVIHARYPSYFIPGAPVPPPPGGESDEQGLDRAMAALDMISSQIQTCAAVVSHSGLNRVLLASLMGRPLSVKKGVPQEYACVSILREKYGVWRVEEAGITLKEWENR